MAENQRTQTAQPFPVRDGQLDRRSFLKYVGAGTAALWSFPALLQSACAESVASRGWVDAAGRAGWPSPPYPVPLPGDPRPHSEDARRLASYEIVDDLTLPEGFRYDVIARWGDVFGPADQPARQIRFGCGNDYTGLVQIPGSPDEFWLLVNHEYVAVRPWIDAFEEVYGEKPPVLRLERDTNDPPRFSRGVYSVDGHAFELGNRVDVGNAAAWGAVPASVQATLRDLARRILSEVGVSIVRVRRLADRRFEVVGDAGDHRRITAWEKHNVDGAGAFRFTGPSAALLTTPPLGTMANCSGATTPWGTFLTCEENFYNEVDEDVGPDGELLADRRRWVGAIGEKVNADYDFSQPVPPTLFGAGHLVEPPLDGRHYGWVAEIDPATGAMRKHTALGRFRHENVALRCEAGKRLAAYMGDDRRGGHVWKFLSDEVVEDPQDPRNSQLLERGTLYVARFNPDYTGEWIALAPGTPLRRPEPEQCFSAHVQVPARFVGGTVAIGDTERDNPALEVDDWQEIIESFTGKPFAESTLGDLVTPGGADADAITQRKLGVLLMDAFAMANSCGGTPTARPEDLEIHPLDRTVYIAFTDATDSSDGSPDRRIFPDSALESSRQYGAIYRLIEGGVESAASDPASTRFTWGKFVSSGEVAEQGGGFACADNMVFDPAANLWMMTDISTTVLNFPTSRRRSDGSYPGGRTFAGVFGNNALFVLPTRGKNAGQPRLFALAPTDAELTGPTFTDDGETLILSVQHPGESVGTRRSDNPSVEQTHTVHDRDNQPFEQKRKVPIGSNFPTGKLDTAPRPAVVCITQRK